MFATKVLRQAAAHAERQPLIKFVGKRSIPSAVDHAPHPHPASPTNKLPSSFTSFSSYRSAVQQHGPLRKSIKYTEETGVGGASGSQLGDVKPAAGMYFDRNELPARFRRTPLSAAEIDAVETGGATLFA